jgi:hypothetical protein
MVKLGCRLTALTIYQPKAIDGIGVTDAKGSHDVIN